MDRIKTLVQTQLPGWAAALVLTKLEKAEEAEPKYRHVGLFMRLPDELASMYPAHGAEDSSPAHVTLFYFGDATEDEAQTVARIAGEALRGSGTIELTLGPVAEFVNAEGATVRYSPVESGGEIEQLNSVLREAVQAEIPTWTPTYAEFKPHVTLEYVAPGTTPEIESGPTGRWTATAVELWGAGSLVSYGLNEPVWLDPPVPTAGPDDAKIAFVGAAPSVIDAARRRPLCGHDGAEFKAHYLAPLGLDLRDVAISNIIPEPSELTDVDAERWHGWVEDQISKSGAGVVVALGRYAAKRLGPLADFNLPHPSVVRRYGDSGEVKRKLRQIKSALKRRPVDSVIVEITKADEAKRIVYGVVLDPYGGKGAQEDAHSVWNPPAAIERTAHRFAKGKRVIGIQHLGRALATVVETHIEQYPTQSDYLSALNNQAHNVWRRKFGEDIVHSGSWILGVELGAEEWQMYLDGKITAFSPGGMGIRTPIRREQMPDVQFIDLVEAAPVRPAE